MRKSQLLKEVCIASCLVITIVFLIGFIPLKYEMINPSKQEFADYDIYDLYYSGRNESNTKRDTNIVIVQVGSSRDEIANQLLKINQLQPAVIGVDVNFPVREDSAGNNRLLTVIQQLPAAVFSYRLHSNEQSGKLQVASSQINDSILAAQGGYLNFLGREHTVVRYYAPFITIDQKEYSALSSKIIEKYAPERFDKLRTRKKRLEIINYEGNLQHYHHFTKEDFKNYYSQIRDLVKGKIVLLGFFSEDPVILDDLKFTPLNHVMAGKSYPDMYGVVVHANILTMLLSGKFATLVPIGWSYLFAFCFTFMLLWFVLYRFSKNPHPPHWKFLLIQFVAITLLIYVFILLFELFKIKIQLWPIILSIVLAVEVIAIYKALARWMHKKMKYETLFKNANDN